MHSVVNLCYPCSFGCCGHGYCSALSVYCHLVLQTVGLFVRQVEWDQECPQYSHQKIAWQPLISSVPEALVFLLHHQLFQLICWLEVLLPMVPLRTLDRYTPRYSSFILPCCTSSLKGVFDPFVLLKFGCHKGPITPNCI